MGTMGYSIPAAIGAKLANKNAFAVAVCGDGAFQMAMNELATVVQSNVDIKIVIMNNHCLGLINELYDQNGDKNRTCTNLGRYPDYKKIAEAYGVGYMHLDSACDLSDFTERLIKYKGCVLAEVEVGEDITSFA